VLKAILSFSFMPKPGQKLWFDRGKSQDPLILELCPFLDTHIEVFDGRSLWHRWLGVASCHRSLEWQDQAGLYSGQVTH
jgi:hypothetical protein